MGSFLNLIKNIYKRPAAYIILNGEKVEALLPRLGTKWGYPLLVCRLAPYMEGKEWPKKEVSHSRLVRDSCNKQGNLLTRLVMGTTRWYISTSTRQNPEVYLEALLGLGHIYGSRWSQQHIAVSRLRPWKWLPLWKRWAEGTLQGQGRKRGAFHCQDQLEGQAAVMSSHDSSNTPPFVTCYYSLTHPSLPQCARSHQQGILLAWRWLIWQLSGCVGGRHHSNSVVTSNRKPRLRQIPKISNNFFQQEPYDPNHWFGVRSLRAFTCVSMWFNEDDALADIRCEHATFFCVWMIA